MKRFRRVFVLGAGFSKAFCPDMPVISDLSHLLFESGTGEDYAELRTFARRYYRASNNSEETHDIENIATVILTKQIFKNDVEMHRYRILRHQLLKMIHQQTRDHTMSAKKATSLTEFVHFCRESDSLLITFNYDLLVESCADVSYGIVNSYQPCSPLSGHTTDYIKLHGSLNWYRAKGAERTDINSVYRVDANDEHFSIHQSDIPVFIPMAHSKGAFLNGTLFSTLWAQAIHYLEQASQIVLIGYSFPPSDIENLYFFLNFKEKIERIVVFFKDHHDRRFERLGYIFGRNTVLNLDAAEYVRHEYLY